MYVWVERDCVIFICVCVNSAVVGNTKCMWERAREQKKDLMEEWKRPESLLDEVVVSYAFIHDIDSWYISPVFFVNLWIQHQLWNHSTNWTFNPRRFLTIDGFQQQSVNNMFPDKSDVLIMLRRLKSETLFRILHVCLWVKDLDGMRQKASPLFSNLTVQLDWSSFVCRLILKHLNWLFSLFATLWQMSQSITGCAKVLFKLQNFKKKCHILGVKRLTKWMKMSHSFLIFFFSKTHTHSKGAEPPLPLYLSLVVCIVPAVKSDTYFSF